MTAAKPKRGRPSDPHKRSRLTAKQRCFVDEYLVDLNSTQAAIRSGYSARTADRIGPELLGKTWVAEAIAAKMAAREKRTEITQDKVLRELAKIGFADIRNAVRWGNTEIRIPDEEGAEPVAYHGLELKASAEIDDDTAAAIAEVSQTKDGLKVKFHDKRAALVDIGKHLGMFIEKVEHSGEIKTPELKLVLHGTRTPPAAN